MSPVNAAPAPGGFVEPTTSTAVRPRPTYSQIQSMLPERGAFTFPAPWSTSAIRLTTGSDCAGNDCVQPVGYSYWRNINNHSAGETMLVVLGLSAARGGTGPTLFRVNKTTGVVEKLGALFPSGSPLRGASGEGWYFSATQETKLYRHEGSRLVRQDVLTGATEVVFDAASQYGSNRFVWQVHSSDDDRVHSATLRDSATSAMLGCMVYDESAASFRYWPKIGQFDECHVDKSGRWLMILDNVDGIHGEDDRIIDLSTNTETMLYDQEGAAGHADTGFGYMVTEDNWGALPGTVRLWKFGQPYVPGTSQGLVVYHTTDWGVGAGHIAHGNAKPDLAAESQYTCSSTASRLDLPRANEIVCYRLDGSRKVLVVAPVLTDLNAGGGGDDYGKSPKGNLDVSGRYFIWTANMGTNRMDAFLVEVPSQLLGGGASDTTAPVVALTSPAPGADVSGSVALAATATDDVSVVGVRFRIDGADVGAEDTSAPYSATWNAAAAAPGAHVLNAVARDAAGNFAVSAGITVQIAEAYTTPPPSGGGSAGPVTWIQPTNLAVEDSTLVKVSGSAGGDDARAMSLQELEGSEVYLEFVAGETTSTRFIGFDTADSPAASGEIDFAIRLAAWSGEHGLAEVRENGVWRADTPFGPADRFRIGIEAGVVRYYRNGVPFHSSGASPVFPLRVHATIFGIGGHIDESMLSGATPTSGPPPEVHNLRFHAGNKLEWDPTPFTDRYHIYRGRVGGLSAPSFEPLCRDDLDPVATDTTLVDTQVPVAGVSFFYLVTGQNAAGEGALDSSTSGGSCTQGS